MSNEAFTWALRDAPGVPAHAVAVLFGLANHADPRGRGAYPSQPTLAGYARKKVRQVRRDIEALEELGLIRRGNQAYVAFLPPDKRPVVWDLAMERIAELTALETGGHQRPGGRGRPAVDDRAVVEDRPVVQDPPILEGCTSEDCDRSCMTGGSCTTARSSEAERPVVYDRQTTLEPPTPTPVESGSDSASAKPAPRKRGTRIPDDFHINESMTDWGRSEFPEFRGAAAETAKFIDYWRALPGQKGVKLDWEATWRNWIRRAAEGGSGGYGNRPAPRGPRPDDLGTPDHLQRFLARAEALEELHGGGAAA